MKRKSFLICALAFMANAQIQAQTSAPVALSVVNNVTESGTISGKIIDKKSNEPLPYVSITIKDEGKVISGAITKENGEFLVSNLPLKKLILEVQFMGYKKFETAITLTKEEKTISLKSILLEDESKVLNEVVVVKEKTTIEQKIDRKIVTIGKDLQSAGATAADIMSNIPTVSVDFQNNTVSLRGNENVRIFIDGKPSNLTPIQVLQQIPSASIKQVELITNPSAKYNPEGMSGIINIVLHKNANVGFNGNLSTGLVFGKTPKFNGSLDLNYRVNKFNFYSTYSLNHGQYFNNGIVHWNNYNSSNDYDLTFDMIEFTKEHFAKIGTDFYINDKNTLSFYTLQTFGNSSNRFTNGLDHIDNTLDRVQAQVATGNDKNQTYNLAFKHKFDKEEKTLDVELNYNLTDIPEHSIFRDQNSVFLRKNDVQKDGKNFIGNIDFVSPIGENSKIELGLETRVDGTTNKFSLNDVADSKFEFNRDIHSAYSNYSSQKGKWNYQLGIRLESYNVRGDFKKTGFNDETFKDYIFTAYPSAFLTYSPSEKNTFNFNYSRRVDRPNMEQVNKIRQWTGLTVEQIGNTELKPQFTNSIELNYTRKTKIGSITSGAFVRFIKDEINQMLTTNPYDSSKQLMTFINYSHNTEYGVEVSGNLDFKKWWSANFGVENYFTSLTGVIEKRDGNLYQERINASLFSSRMNHTFKLTKDLRLIWFTMYRGGRNGLQFSNKEMWKTDLGARINLLKGKGSLTVRYNDIFKTMKSYFYSTEPADISGNFQWESQTFNVNFSYRFGSGKNKALDRKDRDKNESQGGGMF